MMLQALQQGRWGAEEERVLMRLMRPREGADQALMERRNEFLEEQALREQRMRELEALTWARYLEMDQQEQRRRQAWERGQEGAGEGHGGAGGGREPLERRRNPLQTLERALEALTETLRRDTGKSV